MMTGGDQIGQLELRNKWNDAQGKRCSGKLVLCFSGSMPNLASTIEKRLMISSKTKYF